MTTDGGDANLVETSQAVSRVAVKMLDTMPALPGPNGNGMLFGLAVAPGGFGVHFVDDGNNALSAPARTLEFPPH